ncbi:hypothetical protein [Bacillus alveayuensis]|uniref:hypothetical protein n=1 Tax=Aeribacillus alveayuensis TaxID=279215 RepID=UPI000A6EE0E4|nr:hypothetical protein [Bacillus alveayuensis]
MNKLFEREEGTIDKNVFYGEISEWLRISSVHSKFGIMSIIWTQKIKIFTLNSTALSLGGL